MPAYYAFCSWREGRFVRMYACQADDNPEKAYYCLVDTVDEILEFMEAAVSVERGRPIDTYGRFFKVGIVGRVESGSGAVFGTSKYENYFGDWNRVTDKRGLVTDFLAKAKADTRVHRINTDSPHAKRWSPQLPGFCPGDFAFPELFEDVNLA